MKFLISKKVPKERALQNLKQKYQFDLQQIGFFTVIMEKEVTFIRNNGIFGFIDGYVSDFNFDPSHVTAQTESALNFLSTQWPVNDSISGSFSCVIIDELKNEIVLCNDSIGVYPLYYSYNGGNFIISNSLIWISSVSRVEVDEVGIFQRAYCPEFANIGSRTILKDTKRLLPGEWIRLNEYGKIVERKFDNELYQNISQSTAPADYWNEFKKELAYCTGGEENINIALSGGMDSRLVLGGLPQDKQIFCHTYGKKDFYETKIARRIANLYGARFKNYSQPELYFPDREILEKYLIETEAIYLNSWLEVLEEQEDGDRDIILLGDMTESLQGRNLPVKKDWQNFRHYYINRKDYELTDNNAEKFSEWKEGIKKYYTSLISEKHIKRLNLKLSKKELEEEIIKDAEDLIARVKAHNLPYIELISELFTWFTHSRIPMGKQILILNSRFRSFCVPMSVQLLRQTSNLHPNLRINGRFLKGLFTSAKELKLAAGVPTSQIPFVSFNAPNLFKIPIWYLRSEIDDFLIKRMMNSANPKKRYRVLKSFNWVEIYQHPDLLTNLNSAFEKNYLGDYSSSVINGALARRDLKNWPLSNINIVNAAALNIELGLLKEFKDG